MKQFEEISEELPLSGQEGRNEVASLSLVARLREDALIYLTIGGILLAFSIGLAFFVSAVLMNWQ